MAMTVHSAGTPSTETNGRGKRILLCLTNNPNAVIVLFGIYFLVQTIVRQLVPPALRIDEAQQVLFAQWLALGYDAQPPLYNWYQQGVFAVFGTSMVTLALAKNFILFLTFAIYTKTAELVLENKRLVVVAAMALFVVPQVFWQAQRDLTHTAMLMLTFASLIYCTIKLIQRPTTAGYVLVGLAAGLGMLSKYNFALMLPALLVAVWFHPTGRARIFDKRFLLTLGISLVVFIPHVFWLIDNLSFASEVTLERMAEDAPESRFLQIARGLGRFVSSSAIILALPALLLWLSARQEKKRPAATADTVWLRFFITYFIAIAILMTTVILMTTMTELRDRWLLPLLLPFPILATLFLEQRVANVERVSGKFIPLGLFVMVIVPLAMLLSQPLTAFMGRVSSSNYDWQAFRDHIVDDKRISPSLVVTPNWPSGGNLRFVFDAIPVGTTIYDDYDPVFALSEDRPVLMVWTGNDTKELEVMTKWLGDQMHAKVEGVTATRLDVPLYYPVKNKVLEFNYAVVKPSNIIKN
ncbi:4-amino-4-deoxy-L-arabinose transferase-like glycosyltransferase [Rhizobium skierniewicense]|uniref:4-amino-4-deoxy-L-arabinose transferase-like glycosyltransferase n=1 Tax=Rhizobium skierniewicense TaxID=984260 RepID=A0A7W6G1G3_9HYPH|nr:glycosyltransferase family 39 protein [Rhizobium skierniewicense]MBB3945439.1 4-amino-4-deoxy-L-arabinose transferase-like glycosyltransferase [Rhizobium skierniewicense]NTF34041.1 glycosyltransferase family 39 protein [Rhizobium skierniewicense]